MSLFIGALRLHGTQAAILVGYSEAAVIRSWTIAKVNGDWILRARPARLDDFAINHCKGLLFTAPHEGARDGFWAWGVDAIEHATPDLIVAKLGPPEQ